MLWTLWTIGQTVFFVALTGDLAGLPGRIVVSGVGGAVFAGFMTWKSYPLGRARFVEDGSEPR